MKKARSIYMEESDFLKISKAASASGVSFGDYMVDLFEQREGTINLKATIDGIGALGEVYGSLCRAIGQIPAIGVNTSIAETSKAETHTSGEKIKVAFLKKYEIMTRGMTAVNVNEVDSFIAKETGASVSEIRSTITEMGGKYINNQMGECYLRVARA